MAITEYGKSSGISKVRVIINEADAKVKIPLFYARQVDEQFQIDIQTYEGDNQSQTEDKIRRADITVTLGKLDLKSLARIFGKTQIMSPEDGMAWWMTWGDEDEESGTLVGLEYDMPFTDESVTPYVSGTVRRTYHRALLKARRLPGAQYNQANTTVLNFTAERSTVDILGDTISGVGTQGKVYTEGLTT